MKKLIAVLIFLTNMSFATGITQNINTESQQALYIQLIDSKIDNINTKVDSKIDNLKTDFDNKTRLLDDRSEWLTFYIAIAGVLFGIGGLFVGLFSLKYFKDKKYEIEQIFREVNQHYEKIKRLSLDTEEKQEELQEDFDKIDRVVIDGGSASDKTNNTKNSTPVVDEKHHFPDERYVYTKLLYDKIINALMSLDKDVKVEYKKFYIAFKINGNNFVDITPYQKHLTCHINLSQGHLFDNEQITRNVANKGHWGNGDYEYKISSDKDIGYFITLAKQSYEKNKVR